MAQKSGSRLRPWYPFYGSDFQSSTLDWTCEQVGCYVRLLTHQWINGSVPIDDPKRLARIAPSVADHIDMLRPKFPDGCNPRMEELRGEMVDRSEQGRKAARVRWDHVQDTPQDAPEHAAADADAHAPADGSEHAAAMVSTPIPRPISTTRNKPTTTEPDSGSITTVMWDAFKSIYPDRDGTQGMAKALRNAVKLVRSGVPWADIMAGARRYRDQQQASGKVGSKYVKRAEYFLSPGARLWEEPYPVTNTSEQTSRNVETLKRFIDADQ